MLKSKSIQTNKRIQLEYMVLISNKIFPKKNGKSDVHSILKKKVTFHTNIEQTDLLRLHQNCL